MTLCNNLGLIAERSICVTRVETTSETITILIKLLEAMRQMQRFAKT